LPAELRQCLQTISSSPNTTVVITTDKPRASIEQVCWNLPVLQSAEGCCIYRRPGEREWRSLVEDCEVEGREEWMEGVRAVFDYFRERTPGSYIEKQEYQLRWCWDNIQFDFGSAQAREVLIHLWAGPLVNSEAEVVVGDRSITVRPHACSRSACLEKLLMAELGDDSADHEIQSLDFVLCFAVVSHRDEDTFEMLQNLIEEQPDTDSTPLEACSMSADGPDSVVLPGTPRSADTQPRPLSSPRDAVLRTPPGPAPEVAPDEPPPEYDWVPLASRQRVAENIEHGNWRVPSSEEGIGTLQLPSSVVDSEGPSYGSCYTLSLGMKKTKAQHALPHPYHVQNLIRAMAARLPQGPEDADAT